MTTDAKPTTETKEPHRFDTAQDILDRIKAKAALDSGVDLDLLGTIAEHILVADPSATASEDAASAIEKLAVTRAKKS